MFAVLSIKCYLLLIQSVCWKDNEKVLQPLFLTVLAVPSFVFAAETASAPQTTTVDKVLAAKGPTSAQAVVKQENTTVISPVQVFVTHWVIRVIAQSFTNCCDRSSKLCKY